MVLLLAALIVLVSFFTGDGWLINLLPKTFKGLFGIGYYLMVPALAAAAWALLTHRGRPVALRVACALLAPYLFSGIWHMLFCKLDLSDAATLFPTLWETGFTLESGGVLSGGTAHGFMAVLGKPASVIVFIVLLATLLMVVFQVTPAVLLEMWRERMAYDEEDYEDYDPPAEKPKRRAAPPRQAASAKTRAAIDIPLDDTPLGGVRPASAEDAIQGSPKKKNFFQPREQERLTPADVAAAHQEEVLVQTPEPELAVRTTPPVTQPAPEPEPDFMLEPEPAEEPVFEPAPAPEPDPEPAPVPAPAPASERKKKGAETQEAAAQVAAEIADGMASGTDDYAYPSIALLDQNIQENYVEAGAELRSTAQRLADTLGSFGVDAAPGDVIRGPAITQYEFTLAQGVKLSKITNLADDIALALGASGVRIAPIPDKSSVVGIEVPNRTVSPVLIRDVIESRAFVNHKSQVAFAVGRDINNRDIVGDIAKLPHLLIAGTTGSGKSVCTNSLIVSLLYKSSPEDVRFIMVDPKMVELAPYNGIPHLLIPVVTDPKKAAGALAWAVGEMLKRYKTFAETGVRDLKGYNRLAEENKELAPMPQIVLIIDELADLMMAAPNEIEDSICRLAQMARAAGMHLVIATQRPSVDVITGVIKANIPSRIAFAVSSQIDSRTILDMGGAEKLLGRGDMLFNPVGSSKPLRVQGCFVTDEEIEAVIGFIKSDACALYDDEIVHQIDSHVVAGKGGKGGSNASSDAGGPEEGEEDEMLMPAIECVVEAGMASTSLLQRRLKLGYARAARIVDEMETRGIVGPFEGSKPRQVLITPERWAEMKLSQDN